ncbi:hypothetical protein DMUE_2026 [Dictyocoela muelleri]|nr:hypothetical protein DMUE_2026 [Dictyocoela muelleri]
MLFQKIRTVLIHLIANFIIFGSYLFVKSTMNINELRLNMTCDDDIFDNLIEIDLEDQYCNIISQFENKILNNNKSLTDMIIDNLSEKEIHFNKDNKWDINFISKYQDYHTIFVFHFNNEKCILNLNKEDLKKFLTDDFFENFVIPDSVSIFIEKINNENYEILSLIQPIYLKIYKQKPGYQRNIRHIFEFIRGLFNISLKTPNFRIDKKKYKILSGERINLNLENHVYIRKFKTLEEFKGTQFDNIYTMRATQYISGQIYFHHFNKFIKNKKINLSDNLMNIFSVFDNNYKNDIQELIKSMFLDVEIPRNLIIQNFEELNKINNLLIPIRNYIENYTRIKDKRSELNNILQKLKEVLDEKSLSPILLHIINKYFGYLDSQAYFFDDVFSTKLNEAKNFNKIFQDCKNQLIVDKICESGGKNENLVENIIKKNPNDLENPNLSYKEYEKIYPYIYRSEFIAFRIYSFLEKTIDTLKKLDMLETLGLIEIDRNNRDINMLIKEINDFNNSNNHLISFLLRFLNIKDKIIIWAKKMNQKDLLGVLIDINTFNYHQNPDNQLQNITLKTFNLFYSFEDESYFIMIPDCFKYLGKFSNSFTFNIKKNFQFGPNYFLLDNVKEHNIIRIVDSFDQ